MAKLVVEIQDRQGRVDGALTAAEILDEERIFVKSLPLIVGQSTTVDLDPGKYLIRATLPSGISVRKETELSMGGGSVILETRPSAHEWLSWQTFATRIASEHEYWEEFTNLKRRPTLWHRLWVRSQNRWVVRSWPDSWVESDGKYWRYGFESDRFGICMLQLGGMRTPWRCMMLPPSSYVNVLIRPLAGDAIYERGAELAVEGEEKDTEAVLRYLQGGLWESAKITGADLIDKAEYMLWGKTEDPYKAAVGGYFLLRMKEYEKLHDWANNLANWMEWMADGCVIHAWQMLSLPDTRESDVVRSRLLQAVQRGVPILTEGLRLLWEALTLLHQRAEKSGKKDEDLLNALKKVRACTDAADWTQPFTTFYGIDPDTPSMGSKVGVPVEWEGVEYLAEPAVEFPIYGGFPSANRDAISGDVMKRNTFFLVPRKSKWELQSKDDVPGFSTQIFDTKKSALEEAKIISRRYQPSRLIVYKRNGSTEALRRYDGKTKVD